MECGKFTCQCENIKEYVKTTNWENWCVFKSVAVLKYILYLSKKILQVFSIYSPLGQKKSASANSSPHPNKTTIPFWCGIVYNNFLSYWIDKKIMKIGFLITVCSLNQNRKPKIYQKSK